MNINVIKMMIMTAINFVSQNNTSTKNTLCCNEFVLLLVTLEKLVLKDSVRIHRIQKHKILIIQTIIQTFMKEALMKSESGTPSRGKRWTLE